MSSRSQKLTRGKPTSSHSSSQARRPNSDTTHPTSQKLLWAALSFCAALICGWLLLTWVGGIMLVIFVNNIASLNLLGQILIALITLIFMGALAVIALRCRRRFVLLGIPHALPWAILLTILAVLAGFLLGATLLSKQSIGVMAALAESFSTLFMR